jgi:hypothetical protein
MVLNFTSTADVHLYIRHAGRANGKKYLKLNRAFEEKKDYTGTMFKFTLHYKEFIAENHYHLQFTLRYSFYIFQNTISGDISSMMTAILLLPGYYDSSVAFHPFAQHMKNRDTAVFMLQHYYYNTIYSPMSILPLIFTACTSLSTQHVLILMLTILYRYHLL